MTTVIGFLGFAFVIGLFVREHNATTKALLLAGAILLVLYATLTIPSTFTIH